MIVLKHLKYSDYLSRLKMRNVKMNISLLPENKKKQKLTKKFLGKNIWKFIHQF